MIKRLTGVGTIIASVMLVSAVAWSGVVYGADVDELREKIESREDRIQEIEQQIEKYRRQVRKTDQKENTLENKIANLRASQRKLEAEIRAIETRIESKSYTIEKLREEIKDITRRVGNHRTAIEEAIQNINEADSQSLVEAFLRYDTISGFWDEIETLERFQSKLRTRISQLLKLKKQAEVKREEARDTKQELESLQTDLSGKKEVLVHNKQQTQDLLKQTQRKESRYRQILKEKKEQRERFERQLRELESQLQIAIDKSKFPDPGTKVLSAPLSDVVKASCWNGGGDHGNCVTQYFGNTSFSRRNNAYKGNGHNGVDFRAGVGEPVTAAASGVVRATGNTDRIAGCYSYGKWVLIEHPNGLSTLYAHLSVIRTQEGQQVTPNTVIGYAGNTGYSTGPHLHFTTYATEGVRVVPYKSSIDCKQAMIPIADQDAYLDPFNYLSI